MSFVEGEKGEISYWHYAPWSAEGFLHGFTGARHDFSDTKLSKVYDPFTKAWNVRSLFVPDQVHGNTILTPEVSDSNRLGDALIVSRSAVHDCAYGIRTADCLPILLRNETQIALIHSGWRGLANSILANAVSKFSSPSRVEVLIGPAAGPDRYEVGQEVIDSIGMLAVWKSKGGKKLLSLQETAVRILEHEGIQNRNIHCFSVCTISDKRFHSFRRDRELRGSNLCFVIL